MGSKKNFNVQNFMRQFRDEKSRELQKLSAVQFMNVWDHYDKDGKHWFVPQ